MTNKINHAKRKLQSIPRMNPTASAEEHVSKVIDIILNGAKIPFNSQDTNLDNKTGR